MTYSIFDNGNLVSSFDRENEASEALQRLAQANVDAAGGLLLVAFDDAGNAVAARAPGLTGSGRMPQEGEALADWTLDDESAWRRESLGHDGAAAFSGFAPMDETDDVVPVTRVRPID